MKSLIGFNECLMQDILSGSSFCERKVIEEAKKQSAGYKIRGKNNKSKEKK